MMALSSGAEKGFTYGSARPLWDYGDTMRRLHAMAWPGARDTTGLVVLTIIRRVCCLMMIERIKEGFRPHEWQPKCDLHAAVPNQLSASLGSSTPSRGYWVCPLRQRKNSNRNDSKNK